jgi:two-component system sensor histidine kinase KdpD
MEKLLEDLIDRLEHTKQDIILKLKSSPMDANDKVSLLLLFTVSILSVILSVFPVLLAAVLSALIWDFFFIPPHYTFHVDKAEDVLMLGMYLTIALINGILNARIRRYEKMARHREERLKSLKLYNAIGLSIARGFIQAQGDEIIIDNKKSGGALFTIRVPV